MTFLELSYYNAYFCPNCNNYSDKQTCINCGVQLDKTNIKSLREAWEIPPDPVNDIKELVEIDPKELEEIRKKPKGSLAVEFLTNMGLNNTEIKERRVSNHIVSLLDEKIDKLFPSIHYGSKMEIPDVKQLKTLIDLCKWANKLDGHYSRRIMDAGAFYFYLGEYSKAIECWAYEADSEDPESLMFLFKTYRKINWKWHAFAAAMEIADSICPSEELKRKCQNILDEKVQELSEEQLNKLDNLVEKALDEEWGLEELIKLE